MSFVFPTATSTRNGMNTLECSFKSKCSSFLPRINAIILFMEIDLPDRCI